MRSPSATTNRCRCSLRPRKSIRSKLSRRALTIRGSLKGFPKRYYSYSLVCFFNLVVSYHFPFPPSSLIFPQNPWGFGRKISPVWEDRRSGLRWQRVLLSSVTTRSPPHQSPSVTASPRGEAYVLRCVGVITMVVFYSKPYRICQRLPLGGQLSGGQLEIKSKYSFALKVGRPFGPGQMRAGVEVSSAWVIVAPTRGGNGIPLTDWGFPKRLPCPLPPFVVS